MFTARQVSLNQHQDEIIRSYDFDGVVSLGISPTKDFSTIITGRTRDEEPHVRGALQYFDVDPLVPIVFNPVPKSIRKRWHSAVHKAITLLSVPRYDMGNPRHDHIHFDDDELQIDVMREVIKEVHSGSIWESGNEIWEKLQDEGLVDESAVPGDIFFSHQAAFLHQNLKYVYVDCPWIEK